MQPSLPELAFVCIDLCHSPFAISQTYCDSYTDSDRVKHFTLETWRELAHIHNNNNSMLVNKASTSYIESIGYYVNNVDS